MTAEAQTSFNLSPILPQSAVRVKGKLGANKMEQAIPNISTNQQHMNQSA
jgi:hypothetical protein